MFISPFNHLRKDQSAFALPTIILMTLIMTFVSYAALIQSNNNLNLAYKQSYIQIARTAAKSAIDYSQEQFDTSLCGAYTGTAEQDIISNDKYRVTIKAEVLETSADGYEKIVQGTGSVYLPKTSGDAKYVFDIRSEIVRTFALCKTPDNFNPVVWLDASDTDTLKKSSISTNTVNYTTTFGNATASTRGTIEERKDNGAQTSGSWQSNDLEMHDCDTAEFTSTICNSNTTKRMYAGIVFQNTAIPKDSTITSATLSFTGGTPAGGGGNVNHRLYGLYKASNNPHLDLFSSTGTNQVRTPITTANRRTTSLVNFSTNNFPPGNNLGVSVTAVVQEMVNNANWTSGGNLGFGIDYISGNGSRRAKKDGLQLSVTYTASTGTLQANNNESLSQWDDKSVNGNHAIFTHGLAPMRIDSQINNKTIVRFASGDMLSSLNTALSSKREMTVLGVLKPDFSASSSNARIVSGMNTSANNDTGGTNSIIPLLRNASSSGFSNVYASDTSPYRNNYTCGSACEDQEIIVSSTFNSQNATQTTSTIKLNGAIGATKPDIQPSSPYTYNINQIYFGGNRSGSGTGSGVNYFNGDFAEIIVYDHALTCRETESLEEYLRSKWDIYPTTVETVCPAETIPTL